MQDRPGGLSPRAVVLASAALVVLLAALAIWGLRGGDGTTSDQPTGPSSETTTSATAPRGATPYSSRSQEARPTQPAPTAGEQMPDVDAESGLPYVALEDLPPEATRTVSLIDSGGPFPHDEDGSTFGNYEGLLPDHDHGHYREYTVETPGSDDRGARRIVAAADGTLYWTEDHYESFEVIWR